LYFGATLASWHLRWPGAARTRSRKRFNRIVREEANPKSRSRGQSHESVIWRPRSSASDCHRLFRLGECYRKLGKTNDANAQFARILRDFSDQEPRQKLVRENAGRFGIPIGAHDARVTWNERRGCGIARVRAMVKDSPDLMNSFTSGSHSALFAAEKGYTPWRIPHRQWRNVTLKIHTCRVKRLFTRRGPPMAHRRWSNCLSAARRTGGSQGSEWNTLPLYEAFLSGL